MNITLDIGVDTVRQVAASLGLPLRSLGLLRAALRLAARLVPAVLDAVEGKTSSNPVAVAANVMSGLSTDGLDPISARTFELFSTALVSLAFDLQASGPIASVSEAVLGSASEAGEADESDTLAVVACATCGQDNRVRVSRRRRARCGACGSGIDTPDLVRKLGTRMNDERRAP